MSMPVEHDFVDERSALVGFDWARQFTYSNDAGEPIPLTGWVVSFVVYNAAGTAVLTMTSPSSGVSMPTPSSGVFIVSLTAAQTMTIGEGSYTYRLSLTSGSNAIPLAVGRFHFLAGL